MSVLAGITLFSMYTLMRMFFFFFKMTVSASSAPDARFKLELRPACMNVASDWDGGEENCQVSQIANFGK